MEGHQAIIEFAFPGDIVGLGFLQTHICTARASVETVAHCVPFSAQDQLVADDPRAQTRLADAIEREFEFLRRSSVSFSRGIRLAALPPSCSRYRVKTSRKDAIRWC